MLANVPRWWESITPLVRMRRSSLENPDSNVNNGKAMKTLLQTDAQRQHDQVAALAHSLWEKEGCQPDHDLDYWLKAERQFQGGQQQVVRTTSSLNAAASHGHTGTRRRNGNSGQ